MSKKKENKSVGRPSVGQRRSIQISDEEWSRWATAAEKQGITRAEWVRLVCGKAADRELR